MSRHSLGLLSPNRWVMNLSNEVLDIDFDEGAAKMSGVKNSPGLEFGSF